MDSPFCAAAPKQCAGVLLGCTHSACLGRAFEVKNAAWQADSSNHAAHLLCRRYLMRLACRPLESGMQQPPLLVPLATIKPGQRCCPVVLWNGYFNQSCLQRTSSVRTPVISICCFVARGSSPSASLEKYFQWLLCQPTSRPGAEICMVLPSSESSSCIARPVWYAHWLHDAAVAG